MGIIDTNTSYSKYTANGLFYFGTQMFEKTLKILNIGHNITV